MTHKARDLKKQVLLAALDCIDDNLEKTFSFEELLVAAWKRDSTAWGLRGFEKHYPDSERIHRELDSRGKKNKGIVDLGFLEKVRARVYRLTPKGLAAASKLTPSDATVREKADRTLETEIRQILEHTVFKKWLKDPEFPNRFREACHVWGIAPGTPPRVIRERIKRVEHTLKAGLQLLDDKQVDQIGEGRGAHLFDRIDIERCLEFHETLKSRFRDDLKVLGVEF